MRKAQFVPDPNVIKLCTQCKQELPHTRFMFNRGICIACHNENRVKRYHDDDEIKNRIRAETRSHKAKKTKALQEARAIKLAQLEAEIGSENTICKYCEEVTPKTNFRHNRRRCKDCERDEPYAKFTRGIRSDIYIRLTAKNKTHHTIEYLGCSYQNFIDWMLFVNPNYTLINHGEEWHIDHVIPISKFDVIKHPDRAFVAWNWCNTTPLLKYDNLAKNNKIIKEQISEHLKKLQEYHTLKNIKMPEIYVELFAKHLDAGNP